jgi:hypothetical protein
MSCESTLAAWLNRMRTALPLAIGVMMLIALMSGLITLDPVKGQLSRFLFLQQDMAVVVGIILLILTCLRATSRPPLTKQWMIAIAQRPAIIALGLGLICWSGHYFILSGHDLTRDEQMANFDAFIFARGHLIWPLDGEWALHFDALNQLFMLPLAEHRSWVSAYLPVNAAARALFTVIGDANITSPLFVATGALFLWRVTKKLWPEDLDAQAVAMLLYAGSSQVLMIGMTSYAMSGHLALNLLWLLLFLRGGYSHFGVIVVGLFATGLHQPLFHPLFVLPFLLGLVTTRRWRLTACYAVAYLAIGLFWLSWPNMMAIAAGEEGAHGAAGGDGLGYLGRAIAVLSDFGPASLFLMAMNLLRFMAWQHLLMIPLVAAGVTLAWREPLVRPLAAGIALLILTAGILLAFQGHGWGYRYLHGLIGSVCLLGGYGWRALRGCWPDQRLWAAANFATFLIQLPVHAWIAAQITGPYARLSARIDMMPADIVIISKDMAAFARDLVINAPDLSNRPVRLLAESMEASEIRKLCARHNVAFLKKHDFWEIDRAIPMEAADDSSLRAYEQDCQLAGASVREARSSNSQTVGKP